MDNGEEIPGLNEDWTLAGAKLMEWVSGLVMCMVASELFGMKGGSSAPIMGMILLGTTLGLAQLRGGFPDEERGLRNKVMVSLGFPPPGLPPPASIQHRWSGLPVRELDTKSNFHQLNLDALFPATPNEEDE